MQQIVVFGAGGHSKVVIDAIERAGVYKIAGVIDDLRESGTQILGHRVLGKIDDVAAWSAFSAGVVAIGDNWGRSQLVEKIMKLRGNFTFVSVVHPSAVVAPSAVIGAGSVVFGGAVINPDTRIGKHCIVNTKASLDHDNVLEDFASVAPNACTGGSVHIGTFSAICIGANVANGKKIGSHTVVGAGAVVLEDLPSSVLAYGIPAKVRSERKHGAPYLR